MGTVQKYAYDAIRNYEPRTMFAADTTVQKMCHTLKANGTVLIQQAEAGLLGNFNGRYDAMPNPDLLLMSYAGENYTNETISHGRIEIVRPYLSIGLMTQPYMLEELFEAPAFRESGLLARFIYTFPRKNKKYYDTPDIPDELIAKYSDLIYSMLETKYQRFENDETDELILDLEPDSLELFTRFFNEYQKTEETEMSNMLDWSGKYHGLILRLTGILHVLDCCEKGCHPEEILIPISTLERGLLLAEYFRQSALYAYTAGEAGVLAKRAEHVIHRVKAKGLMSIRQNELLRLCSGKKIMDTKQLNEAVEYLEELNYCKRKPVPPSPGGTRWGFMIYFNPDIYK